MSAMSRSCCVCERSLDEKDGVTYALTAEEKALMSEAPDEVHYCVSCHHVMQDRQAGADLLKGMLEMRLRLLGVGNAKKLADTFRENLLKNAAKKMH